MTNHSRRDTISMLLSAVPSLSLLSLTGCTGEPSSSRSSDTPTDTITRPTLDTNRLTAGLTAVLANSPWADRIETLVAGATAEIAALRAAGYDDTADVATHSLNGVVANVAAGFGENMAARGSSTHDYTALSEAIISELSASCVAIRASLPAATAEIREALGSDTVPGDADAATSMAADEAELRQQMFDKGLSGQGGMNLLLGQMQSTRVGVTAGVSLAASSSDLDAALSGMASDDDVDSWSARSMRRMPLRPVPPPPPTDISELCDVVAWVGFFTGWMGAIHKAVGKTAEKMAQFVDELPEAYAYLKASWTTWLAADLTEEVLGQTESAVLGAIQGELTETTAEQCNQIAAFIIVVLWFVSIITALIAFAQTITWLAGTVGVFTPGGTIALMLILMLVVIFYYVLEMVCAVIGILPTLNVMFGECGE
ncbi:MAG: hypothetical protein ACI8RZ_002215 [Myxococcota bacterium]|jgi:hypothetical protein